MLVRIDCGDGGRGGDREDAHHEHCEDERYSVFVGPWAPSEDAWRCASLEITVCTVVRRSAHRRRVGVAGDAA
jgi:hypothetical protein